MPRCLKVGAEHVGGYQRSSGRDFLPGKGTNKRVPESQHNLPACTLSFHLQAWGQDCHWMTHTFQVPTEKNLIRSPLPPRHLPPPALAKETPSNAAFTADKGPWRETCYQYERTSRRGNQKRWGTKNVKKLKIFTRTQPVVFLGIQEGTAS